MTTYPQFCALARAAEIVGERWTLLIVRELCLAPKRFSDLRRRLAPVTSSVLTERLNSLEERGVVERYDWPGPVPGKVFRLTPDGEALRPVIHELTRWGARYLFPQRPGEAFEGDWLRLVFEAYASKSPSPSHSYEVRVTADGESAAAFLRGGESGTEVHAAMDERPEVSIEGDPAGLLGAMSGRVDVGEAARQGRLRVRGETSVARLFPALFEMGQ